MAVKLAVAQFGKGGADGGMDVRGQGLEGSRASGFQLPVHHVAAYGGLGTPMCEELAEIVQGVEIIVQIELIFYYN